jgi:Type I phosphodiesterase / nucleotide pyrophosphatase
MSHWFAKFRFWAAFLPGLLLAGCAAEFDQVKAPAPALRGGRKTVLLFVVDGLAADTLQEGLSSGRLPGTRAFFLRGGSGFPLGLAAFPTLTYPNLSAILTASPVGAEPVLSNHMVLGEPPRIVSFESPVAFGKLRSLVDPESVIGQMEAEGQESASFSYVLGLNASDHMEAGAREGLEYARHDYRDLDDRLLRRLETFLEERDSPAEWPAFIYVHLVGVDGLSHLHGPRSRLVQDYLAWLDRRLKPVFQRLERAERAGFHPVTALTADHGFVESRYFVDLEKALQRIDRHLLITNEARFLGLHFPAETHSDAGIEALLAEARKMNGVEFTAALEGQRLVLESPARRREFALGAPLCPGEPVSLAELPGAEFRCLAAFDEATGLYPYLISNLARFLTAPHHPDALVEAKPEVVFTRQFRGNHGGLTAEELYVPVLLRGAKIAGSGPLRTSDLLKSLREKPALAVASPEAGSLAQDIGEEGRSGPIPGHFLQQ